MNNTFTQHGVTYNLETEMHAVRWNNYFDAAEVHYAKEVLEHGVHVLPLPTVDYLATGVLPDEWPSLPYDANEDDAEFGPEIVRIGRALLFWRSILNAFGLPTHTAIPNDIIDKSNHDAEFPFTDSRGRMAFGNLLYDGTEADFSGNAEQQHAIRVDLLKRCYGGRHEVFDVFDAQSAVFYKLTREHGAGWFDWYERLKKQCATPEGQRAAVNEYMTKNKRK